MKTCPVPVSKGRKIRYMSDPELMRLTIAAAFADYPGGPEPQVVKLAFALAMGLDPVDPWPEDLLIASEIAWVVNATRETMARARKSKAAALQQVVEGRGVRGYVGYRLMDILDSYAKVQGFYGCK